MAKTVINQENKFKLSADPSYSAQKIFTGGLDGYHSYRIPSLIRTVEHGYLIAICEGRNDNNKDYGNINIVCKRSFDDGVTWQPLQAIAGPGNYTDGNPTTVVDQSTGKIFVFMLHNDSTHYSNPDGSYLAFQPGDRTVWVCSSTDEGATWSAPVNVTSTTQPSGTAQDWIGPGTGIYKLHGTDAGTLIIPAYGRNIYSTNHGITWTESVITNGTTKSTESTIIEKLNGDLLRNDRPTSTLPLYRQVATGSLGGGFPTWASNTNLPDPASEGSVWRYNDPKPNRILFLNSASQTTRTAMKIRISYDEGTTYPIGRDIPSFGSSPGKLGGYSSLAKTADLQVGALIEYNEDTGNSSTSHRSIVFHKFNLPWIVNGATEPVGY
ncbi:sialidase family protein [Hufsiella arboris]|uniref:sialidase family protein n=1 Tax=Hufsiella arboris TaxID=2695275 RepID=UPI001927715C|nr:sialidase family protein [Hufsiella arboris]